MTTVPVRPVRGGFLRPFGCGTFIREFLLGRAPQGAPPIDPNEGAPQADLFYEYKSALLRATALDRATRAEEEQARREGRAISHDEIERLTEHILARLPYRTRYARYSSFVKYFGGLQRLGWVEATGREEPSAFQTNYPPGPPRRWYRLTSRGRLAGLVLWANPKAAEYPVAVLAPPRPPPAAPPVPERPRRRRAAPPAPPAAPPTPRRAARKPAAPPTPAPPVIEAVPGQVPPFIAAPIGSVAAASSLIAHLRTVQKVGLVWPDVRVELQRLAGVVGTWADRVDAQVKAEMQARAPDAQRVALLSGRRDALQRAAQSLRAEAVLSAIEALQVAYPGAGRQVTGARARRPRAGPVIVIKAATPSAPPTPPPTAPAPARPPTEIPAFAVAPKPSRAAAQRLITHLRKVEKVGVEKPEVTAELERLAGEVSGWAELVGEARDEEEGKEEPNEDRLDTLQDRLEALENVAAQLEAGDVADAIGTLDDAWPPPGRPAA